MEIVSDEHTGQRAEWDDDEWAELTEQAKLARDELLGMVEDTSSETLPSVEPTTSAMEYTIASFEFDGDRYPYMVYWEIADGLKYTVFQSDKGTLCRVSSVSGVADYINNELLSGNRD